MTIRNDLTVGCGLLFAAALLMFSEARAQQPVDPGFSYEFVHYNDTSGIISLRFDGAGRLFASEKQGRVLRFDPDGMGGFEAPLSVLDISAEVDAGLERGLLGLALDPDFSTNRTLYLLYSTASDQRVVSYRLDASLSGVEAGSANVLLSGLPNDAQFHKAGDLHFSPGDPDHLFVALGDDGRPDLARATDNYIGKILRIHRTTGLGTIDNPFYDGDLDSAASRVWATGFRNPFRFAFHPGLPASDVLYASENGDATDRISWVRRGSDGYWDTAGDGSVGCAGGCFLDPGDPNHRVMVRIEPSQIGIAIAASGPFAVGGMPTLYAGNWFPNEFSVRRWQLTGTELDSVAAIPGDQGGPFIDNVVAVDLTFGPDGCLYLSSSGVGDSEGSIFRTCAVASSPPTAAFAADVTRGPAPLTVSFTDMSTDADGMITARSWDFGDGQQSAETSPTHTYTAPGDYRVTLTVTDDAALAASTQDDISAFAAFTLNVTGSALDANAVPPTPVSEPLEFSLYRLDGITPVPFAGGTGTGGNVRSVPAGGVLDATYVVELLEPGLRFEISAPGAPTLGSVHGGFVLDPAGTTADRNLNVYLAETSVVGQVRSTRGDVPRVDVGARRLDGSPVAVGGGRDYFPGSGIPLTGVAHRVDTDELGFFHLAIPSPAVDEAWMLDAPGDTNEDVFGAASATVSIVAESTVEADLLLGLFAGGTGCDDLAALPAAPPPYAVIQNLFSTQCTGCHTAVSSNSAGLDLTAGSLDRITRRFSDEAPGVLLVQPGDPGSSYLFEKVNCAQPQAGSRMRPTNAMDPQEQALLRDWIADHVHYGGFERRP